MTKQTPALDADDMNRPSPAATPNRQPPAATLDRQSPAAPPPLDLNLWLDESNELMLVVQILGNGSSCYSLVSTINDSFEVVVKDDLSSLSALLKSQNCNPELYAKPYNYQVVTACNPWILVTCEEIDETGLLQFLWNPFTNEIKTLPPFTSEPPLPSPLDSGISFYGLGIDTPSGDYKIVRARAFGYTDEDPDDEMKVQAELLSLETGLWKEIPYPYQPQMPVSPSPVHINGFCYWTASDMFSGELSICSFDFAKQKFSPELIPMPESDRIVDMCTVALAEFRGSLAVVAYDDKLRSLVEGEPVNRETSDIEVWVWNNGSWSKEHSCTIPAKVFGVSGLFRNNKLLLVDSKGELLLYDCGTNKLVNLCSSDDNFGVVMYPLFESSSL